jgi:hypothetical protein
MIFLFQNISPNYERERELASTPNHRVDFLLIEDEHPELINIQI